MAVNASPLRPPDPEPEPTFPGADALDRLPTASKDVIRSRELQQRVDSKFFGPVEVLAAVLPALEGRYAVIRVPTGVAADYRSLYFDTPDLRCYHDHRRGRRLRHKIRIRHYPDRELSFLEIKSKRNERVTDKHRLALPYGSRDLDDAGRAFLRQHCDLPVDQLELTLDNWFRRIIVFNLEFPERITIDLGLHARYRDQTLDLARLTILEVKQWPYSAMTPMMVALREHQLRERSVSKYTTAIAQLVPGVARNRILPLLRTLHRTIA